MGSEQVRYSRRAMRTGSKDRSRFGELVLTVRESMSVPLFCRYGSFPLEARALIGGG